MFTHQNQRWSILLHSHIGCLLPISSSAVKYAILYFLLKLHRMESTKLFFTYLSYSSGSVLSTFWVGPSLLQLTLSHRCRDVPLFPDISVLLFCGELSVHFYLCLQQVCMPKVWLGAKCGLRPMKWHILLKILIFYCNSTWLKPHKETCCETEQVFRFQS